jgi:Chlorophyll A-B binding protein
MKIAASAIILASVATGASAFSTSSPQLKHIATAMRMADVPATPEGEPTIEFEPPTEPELPKMSQALPFLVRPASLDGTLAGDVGFDPFGFAKSKADLINYREAEIKHARLAMLAAAGWPLSELWDKKIATVLNLTPLVDAHDRAPSLLNGGLGHVSPAYWAACLLAAGAIDLYGINRSKSNDPAYFPGNLGFDPLGLYPKSDSEAQLNMQLKELKNGRLAMIAITAFAIQEFVSTLGVVDETPLFFKPLGAVLHEYANSGYIVPN